MDTEAHELIAGYALDALDEADRARAEALLASSEEARDELRAYSDVAAAMATAVAGPAPPADLRERILGAVRTEPQNVVSLEERRRSRVVPVLGVAAALAACAAIAAGIWGASVSSDLDDARAALEQERAAAAVLAQPASESALTGAGGRLAVGEDGNAVLVLAGAPPVPAGKAYQVWVIDPGQSPSPAGLFAPSDRTLAVPVDGAVRDGSVVAVTVEDADGVDAPTSDPVITSAPVTLS